MNDSMLSRLDKWNERSHWLPDPESVFPAKVFWGFFIWNFPILAIVIGGVGTMAHSALPDPSGEGMFTSLNWAIETTLIALAGSAAFDLAGCLWIRSQWNKRARALRCEEESQE